MVTDFLTASKIRFLCSICVFLASSIDTSAQITGCDQILMVEADPVAKEKIIRSRKNIIISENGGKTGFAVFGMVMDSSITFSIRSVGAGPCAEPGDRVVFVFTDSSKLELSNMGKANCEAQSFLYFNPQRNNFTEMKLLAEKQVGKLTVWTKERFFTQTLNDEMATKIVDLVSCLSSRLGSPSKLPEDAIFTIVEQQPEFYGAYQALLEFIGKSLRSPAVWKKDRSIEGMVHVEFTITEDGSVADVKTVRSVHPDLDAEAERVIKKMPPWRPAMQHGKPVRVKFTIPIKFKGV